jgi:dihydrofolate reductase
VARLVFSMNVSLDGYVDHDAFGPGPALFQHFVEQTERQAGALYGRVVYELMRYWELDDPTWGDAERAFAAAWRRLPKWVASRTLTAVGPGAQLLGHDLEGDVRRLKAEVEGEIDVAGPTLGHHLGVLGLVDEYRLYVHPVVLGAGRPFFAGALPRLRLAAHELIAEDVVRLSYVPSNLS